MTAYRIDEFESDDDEEFEDSEGRELPSKDVQNEAILVTEVVEPRPADTTRRMDIPLEVHVEKFAFKTKCQLMQEEVEDGKCSFVVGTCW